MKESKVWDLFVQKEAVREIVSNPDYRNTFSSEVSLRGDGYFETVEVVHGFKDTICASGQNTLFAKLVNQDGEVAAEMDIYVTPGAQPDIVSYLAHWLSDGVVGQYRNQIDQRLRGKQAGEGVRFVGL